MSQYGSTFATAEVITESFNSLFILTDSIDDNSYFKFTITDAINEIEFVVDWIAYPNWVSGVSEVSQILYDSTETQIDINTSTADDIIWTKLNLPVGDYYLRFQTTDNDAGTLNYDITISNNGVYTIEDIINISNISTHQLRSTWNIDFHYNMQTMYKFKIDQSYLLYPNRMYNFSKPRTTEFHMSPYDQDVNIIEGIINFNGVAIGDKVVRLYNKKSGIMMDETISNELGEYKFNALLTTDKYYIIAFDDLLNPIYQAMALDSLTPKIVKLTQ